MVSASPGEEAEEAPSSAGLQAQGAQSDAVQASPGPVGAGRPEERAGRWRGGSAGNFTPLHAKRHNCVRVSFKEDVPEEVTIDRPRFVRSVMVETLKVDPADLFCLIALPGGRAFDVSFKTSSLLQRFMTLFEEKAGERPLSLLKLQLLSELDTKVVTIFLYNEALPDHDVEVWLRQHCLVLSDSKRVQDSLGIWTGARQWRVRLRTAEGALQHIPSALNIGGNRGYVVYAGQPKLCRRCGGSGHLAAACEARICYRCKARDHVVTECCAPALCNLCGNKDHLYRDCPLSYANKVRAHRSRVADGEGEVAEDGLKPTQPGGKMEDGGGEVGRQVVASQALGGMATKRSGVLSRGKRASLAAAEAEDGVVRLSGGGGPAEERDEEDVPEEVTIDRPRYVRTVMVEVLKVDPADLFCLIALPGGRAFDVSFKTKCCAPALCNLCGNKDHLYRDCPLSYANKVRAHRSRVADGEGEVAEDGLKPTQPEAVEAGEDGEEQQRGSTRREKFMKVMKRKRKAPRGPARTTPKRALEATGSSTDARSSDDGGVGTKTNQGRRSGPELKTAGQLLVLADKNCYEILDEVSE
ncbi:uncharacterized protein LOC144738246 [Lampetra planeri]